MAKCCLVRKDGFILKIVLFTQLTLSIVITIIWTNSYHNLFNKKPNLELSVDRDVDIPNDIINDDGKHYKILKIPIGTFTFWLSHIESNNRINDKAYFADKYLVKKFITNYTKQYPIFSSIKCAKIIYDCDNGLPSIEELKEMKQMHKGFLVKPNHFSGEQFVFNADDNITNKIYQSIIKKSRFWLNRKFRKRLESWYQLIESHIFIEENLNINPMQYPLVEYKIHVFNQKALFVYLFDEQSKTLSLYTLPRFEFINVTWGAFQNNKSYIAPIPSKQNLNLMLSFAEHFATTQKWKYVRVDLYVVNDTIYFSEFTFAPGGGNAIIKPLSFDYFLFTLLDKWSGWNKNDVHKHLINEVNAL